MSDIYSVGERSISLLMSEVRAQHGTHIPIPSPAHNTTRILSRAADRTLKVLPIFPYQQGVQSSSSRVGQPGASRTPPTASAPSSTPASVSFFACTCLETRASNTAARLLSKTVLENLLQSNFTVAKHKLIVDTNTRAHERTQVCTHCTESEQSSVNLAHERRNKCKSILLLVVSSVLN